MGNAVARNRVKRLCRECFRLRLLPLPDRLDLVIIARTGAAGLDRAAVSREWADVQRHIVKRCSEALAQIPPKTHDSPSSGGP